AVSAAGGQRFSLWCERDGGDYTTMAVELAALISGSDLPNDHSIILSRGHSSTVWGKGGTINPLADSRTPSICLTDHFYLLIQRRRSLACCAEWTDNLPTFHVP